MNKIKRLNMSLVGDTARKSTWTFTGGWNASLDQMRKDNPWEHNYLYASQLGNSQIDIFLNLMGTETSNGFDVRAKRKFDAGVMWEWIVTMVAKRAGIYLSSQDKVKYQIEGGLEVSGKLDLKVGGLRNMEMIQEMDKALEIISLPEVFIKAMKNVESSMNFETVLPTRIIEVKSSSAFMYEAQYKYGIPAENHALQCLHYLLATKLEEGAVLYISKDDARMCEIPIWRDDNLLNEKYKEIVTLAKMYYDKKERPPLEPMIIFDCDKGKFTDNWNIKYSAYLTYLYGFEVEGDYQDVFKSKVGSWNRVVGRIKRGEKMTASNLQYIDEIKVEFSNFDEIVETFKLDEAFESEKEGD